MLSESPSRVMPSFIIVFFMTAYKNLWAEIVHFGMNTAPWARLKVTG